MTDQKQYTAEELLINYFTLHEVVTGEKVTGSISVTPNIYTNYVQQTQNYFDMHNGVSGFKDSKVMFNGVELVKKLKLEVK